MRRTLTLLVVLIAVWPVPASATPAPLSLGVSRRIRAHAPDVLNLHPPGEPRRQDRSTAGPRPQVIDAFDGRGDADAVIPPGPSGAVGPGHVLLALNDAIEVRDRTGALLSTTPAADFWRWPGVHQQRITYDTTAGRWLVVAGSGRDDPEGGWLHIGVSRSSNPFDGWYAQRYFLLNDWWPEATSIGFGGSWVLVQLQYHSVRGYERNYVYMLDRATFYADGYPNYIRGVLVDPSWGRTIAPAANHDGDSLFGYFASTFHYRGVAYVIRWIASGSGDAGAIGGWLTASPWAWSASPPGDGDVGPQAGSSAKINVGDDSIQTPVVRNGSLWLAHTVFLPPATPTISAVQWWQLGVDGTLHQAGRIEDPDGQVFTAFPSIAPTADGDAVLGYSRFAPTGFASAAISVRVAGDAPGTMRAAIVAKPGVAPYDKKKGGSRNLWGDFSTTVVDPNAPGDVWTVQPYAASPSGGIDRWGTWWARVRPRAEPQLRADPGSLDFGVRGVGRTRTLALSLTNDGTGITTIGGVTIDDPAQYSVTGDACGPTVAIGETCALQLEFSPAVTGTFDTMLRIAHDGAGDELLVPLHGAGVADVTPPQTAITSSENDVILPLLRPLRGTVTDGDSGVEQVTVTFTGSTVETQTSVVATLACDENGRACSWTAAPPLIPDVYFVHATSVDVAGNADEHGDTQTVVVV